VTEMTKITIGFEIGTGKEVAISPNHIFIAGTTSVGKSQLMKAMIERSEEKILVLDVKQPPDYSEFPTIPLFIKQAMDALKLKNLVESTERISIKFELAELSRLCRKSKNWNELLENAREKQQETKIHPVVANVLEVLILLIEKLSKEFQRHSFSQKVELPHKVNVMDLSDISRQLQQVVVASVLDYILRRRKNITTVIDEVHRFIPQAAASAAREEVTTIVREGRAKGNFLWLADQTVTGIDKDALKQAQVWILGRQAEKNEADRTLDQIPQRKSLGLSRTDIQTLGLGEFIVVTPKWAKRIYAWPNWVPRQMAIEVAKGNMTAEDVAAHYEQSENNTEDEEMWSSQYKSLSKDYEKLKKEKEKLETDIEKLRTLTSEDSSRLKRTAADLKQLKKQVDSSAKESKTAEKDLDLFRQFKQILHEMVGSTVSISQSSIEVPESIGIETEQPAISVIKRVEPLKLTEEDTLGKIALLYANGELPTDKWFTTGVINKLFQTHAWPILRGSHMPDALDKMTQWGYFKKQYSGRRPEWRIKMLLEEAQDRGLLKVQE